ncbi:MAG: hypothetical protein LBL52_01225 [Rickettsiales bacterium]|nr:hypothetical protein [Rickettsiales bacterium]
MKKEFFAAAAALALQSSPASAANEKHNVIYGALVAQSFAKGTAFKCDNATFIKPDDKAKINCGKGGNIFQEEEWKRRQCEEEHNKVKDPLKDVGKRACYYEGREVAANGGNFTMPADGTVFYGAGNMAKLTSGAQRINVHSCTNKFFGDPASGVRKSCYNMGTGKVLSSEGGDFTLAQ